jgi:iron complex transport system substrate-binding protein
MKRRGAWVRLVVVLSIWLGTAMPALAKPSRIVSLNLCTDQLLVELVPRERIAALTMLAVDRDVSAIADRAKGQRLINGAAEEVISLDPDLVLASPIAVAHTVDLLRRLGKRIELVPFATSFDEIRATVRQVAMAVEEVERGEAIVARFDAALAAARSRAVKHPEALVYQVNGLVSGTGSLADAALKAAGLANQAERRTMQPGAKIALESVVVMPPDLVVLAQGMNTYRTVVSDNLRHPALARVMARTAGMELPMPLWLCGTPQVAEAVGLLAAARDRLPSHTKSQ